MGPPQTRFNGAKRNEERKKDILAASAPPQRDTQAGRHRVYRFRGYMRRNADGCRLVVTQISMRYNHELNHTRL